MKFLHKPQYFIMATPLHDGLLNLSVGKSRFETKWKNKELSWSDLIKRLSKTTVTSETYAEYMAFPPKLQDEKKDVGGFVGGTINGGRRKPENIAYRSVLTLDIDFGKLDFWSDFQLVYGEAAALYSTHKHHKDNPRFRLVMPLKREVFADEYQAIARKVAQSIDIEIFDITTYQAERLMYWPSTPKDQEYYFMWQDGPWLDPDEILGLYTDWHDTTEWPISKREKAKVVSASEKQGEPTEKPGIVGAFCRVYDITSVINAFLSDVYEPTDKDDRWTYRHGSTAGGLIIYDEKFAFSHHGTDPISGKLCNAFDLVRLHKYGKMDEDVDGRIPINKRPSHLEMEAFALKDKNVKIDLLNKSNYDLQEDFKDIIYINERGELKESDVIEFDTKEEKEDWRQKLDVNKKGEAYPTSSNYLIILRNDKGLKNSIGYNDFTHIDTVINDLPWRRMKEKGEPFGEMDHSALRNYIEYKFKSAAPTKIKDAFLQNRYRVKYHPVRDYLNSLKWDETKRLDTLLVQYFGAEHNIYVENVTRKAIVACVARVFEPGCKFDNVLTLVGPQGVGKSTLFNKLGKSWFSDSLGAIDNPRIFEQLQGSWIIEIGELAGIRKADVELVKHFISKQEDKFRVAYGTHTELFKRQCVFFGTTNTDDFLIDSNGNRRFWPVTIRPEFAESSVFSGLDHEIDQIWAEAVQYYKQGEDLFLTPEVEAIAFKIQNEHTEYDDRRDVIIKYLDTPIDEMEEGTPGELRSSVTVAELWVHALNGRRTDLKHGGREMHKIMKSISGWKKIERTMWTAEFGASRGYQRLTNEKKR